MSTTDATKATASDRPKGWEVSSTVRACEAEGVRAGQEYGRSESRALTLCRLLRRQARHRFGGEDPAGVALLDALARGWASTTLEELSERLPTADGWASWLAGVEAPPPAPGFPDYVRNLEINLEPYHSSIDNLAQVTYNDGKPGLVLIRLQKDYHPDLDKRQYEESKRLEQIYKMKPIIVVILMWPQADGPGIKGYYKGRDRTGKPFKFTYQLRRAWTMPVEGTLHSVGTVMFAPLAKGAKKQMPEIIRRIAQELDKKKLDEEARGTLWVTIYWNMGVVCTLEEAHAALGPERVAQIRANGSFLAPLGRSFLNGHEEASKTEPLATARVMILRQGTRRFGANPEAEKVLAGLDRMDQLECWIDRLLTAPDWGALLGQPS